MRQSVASSRLTPSRLQFCRCNDDINQARIVVFLRRLTTGPFYCSISVLYWFCLSYYCGDASWATWETQQNILETRSGLDFDSFPESERYLIESIERSISSSSLTLSRLQFCRCNMNIHQARIFEECEGYVCSDYAMMCPNHYSFLKKGGKSKNIFRGFQESWRAYV